MHDPETLKKAMDLYVRTATIMDPIRMRAWKDRELTVTQLLVLFLLRETPGTSAGELAEELHVTPPTVTGLVDRLVRIGLVQREEDLKDRRLVRNVLTKQGEQILAEAERDALTVMTQLFERLTPRQLSRLIESLQVLVTVAEEMARLEVEGSAAT
jgi:DNA-binding MarR family transcriptional regulator